MQTASLSPRAAHLIVGVPLALFAGLIGIVLSIALVFSSGAQGCGTTTSAGLSGQVEGTPVPARLAPIYEQAAKRYKLDPRGPSVLASINWNESGFGTNMGSPPGAMGWMSFLPESWEDFGLDGDGDGDRDAFDPWDAIFSAAHLLSITGAPEDWHGALFSYNHSDEYVANVLEEAEQFAAAGDAPASTAGAECVAAPGGPPGEKVAAMVAEAERLSQLRPHTDYEYGGSHGESPTPANGPFDCSSAVSHLLQIAGFENPTMDTIAFSAWGEPGPGKWVTLHNKPYGADAHIFVEFHAGVTPPQKRYWGTSGFWFSGHGPGWIPESTFDLGYLGGFELRHPPGL